MRFLPVLGVMALIFLLSHTPGTDLPQAINGLDKLCHGLAYAILAAAALFAYSARFKKSPISTLWFILFFCLVYGISDEYHQSFVPGRYPSVADVVADITGAGLFLGSWWLSQRRRISN